MNKENKKINQRGNVVFLILIAVALFGALSYAVVSGGRGAVQENESKMKPAFSEIQNTIAAHRVAIMRMLMNGTVPNASYISAYSPEMEYWTANTNCNELECRMYDSQGGALAPYYFKYPELLDGVTKQVAWPYRTWWEGNATDGGEIILVIGNVTKEFCAFYNEQIGIDEDPDSLYSALGIYRLDGDLGSRACWFGCAGVLPIANHDNVCMKGSGGFRIMAVIVDT